MSAPRTRTIAIQMRFAQTTQMDLPRSHVPANLGSKGMVRILASVSIVLRVCDDQFIVFWNWSI